MHRKNSNDKTKVTYDLKKLNIKEVCKTKTTTYCEDTNECPICLSKNENVVALKCTHKLCERCICRFNMLVKTKNCPICKQENIICVNKKYMDYKCMKCSYEAKSLVNLIHHYKSHKIIICEECVRHKNEFADEFILYTYDEIHQHKKKGTIDENKNGFYGHIYCHFCKKYFYDADECKKHCRKAHFLCTVCETIENRHQYYNNHADLNRHMREMHYVCDFSECNGISFAMKLGLSEHLLKIHKIGTGSSMLNNDLKTCSVPVMAPYDLEMQNSAKIPKAKPKAFFIKDQNINKTVPSALNRSMVRQVLQSESRLAEALKRKYPLNHEEFLKASTKFQKHESSPEIYLEEIEILIGGKETIAYAEDVVRYYNEDDQRVLCDYLKKYKNQVLFPKFVKSDKKIEQQKTKKTESFGFKILEIRKKK